jgi:hypothetical protein
LVPRAAARKQRKSSRAAFKKYLSRELAARAPSLL